MEYVVAVVLAAALLVSITGVLARMFPAIDARVWAGLLVVAAGVGAHWGWGVLRATLDGRLAETSCEVLAPVLRDAPRGRVELVARVRWQPPGGGGPLTTKGPLVVGSASSERADELVARLPHGARTRCLYATANPRRILAADDVPSRAMARAAGGLAIVASVGALVIAGVWWRRARRGRGGPTGALDGAVGVLVVGAMAAAAFVRGPLGAVLGIGGAVAMLAVIVREVRSGERGFAAIAARLEDPRPWPRPGRDDDDGDAGVDPYANDRVTGTYGGREVWAALHAAGATLEVTLLGWPAGLWLHVVGAAPRPDATPEGDDDTQYTGDEAFDARFRLGGPDGAWRAVLDAPTRAQLHDLLARPELHERGTLRVAGGKLILALPERDAGALVALLEHAVALPARITTEPLEAQVLALAPAEPDHDVRFGHYRWLVARGWEVPRVLRTAAADPDRDIATWAAGQLPPEAGAFR